MELSILTFMHTQYQILKVYKDHIICQPIKGKGMYVINLDSNTNYRLDLDDSKLSGKRVLSPLSNAVLDAMKYIDVLPDESELAGVWYCKGSNTIRTKENCMIAKFANLWVIDPDSHVNKSTVLAVTTALVENPKARFHLDGSQLVDAAKALF